MSEKEIEKETQTYGCIQNTETQSQDVNDKSEKET